MLYAHKAQSALPNCAASAHRLAMSLTAHCHGKHHIYPRQKLLEPQSLEARHYQGPALGSVLDNWLKTVHAAAVIARFAIDHYSGAHKQ